MAFHRCRYLEIVGCRGYSAGSRPGCIGQRFDIIIEFSLEMASFDLRGFTSFVETAAEAVDCQNAQHGP